MPIAPRSGLRDAGNRVDDARLAGARRAEQTDDRRVDGEPHGELECAERCSTSTSIIAGRVAKRRVSHSEATSATIDSTTAMMLSRSADASPPGTCVNV